MPRGTAEVYSIAVTHELTRQSELRLKNLGYNNISLRYGDGYSGRPESAPLDGITVTAGTALVLDPLVAQPKVGGRMVYSRRASSLIANVKGNH